METGENDSMDDEIMISETKYQQPSKTMKDNCIVKIESAYTEDQPTKSTEVLEILKNVTRKCFQESMNNDIDTPLANTIDRVFSYTGIEISKSLAEEVNSNILFNTSINIVDRIKIYSQLNQLHKKGISLTIKDLYESIGNLKDTISLPQFKQELYWMGFEYRMINNKKIFMEDPTITFERYLYLKKVRKMRQKTKHRTYYIEARQLDLNLEFKQPQQRLHSDEKIMNTFLYLMSEHKGHEHSLLLNNATLEEVDLWLNTVVPDKMSTNSNVIVNSNPLFESLNTLNISKYSSKDDMLKWLKQNKIPCNQHMHKAELFELIRKYPKRDPEYKIDVSLRRSGHNVLRLPRKLHDLTPTEELWNYIRKTITGNVSPLPTDMTALQIKIGDILLQLQWHNWKNMINSVVSKEIVLLDIET